MIQNLAAMLSRVEEGSYLDLAERHGLVYFSVDVNFADVCVQTFSSGTFGSSIKEGGNMLFN